MGRVHVPSVPVSQAPAGPLDSSGLFKLNSEAAGGCLCGQWGREPEAKTPLVSSARQ